MHAIEAHHNEVQPQTIEAVLTQASDACSGGRPGARRESLEAYVKRLERIEEIAAGKSGVEKVFAMQAGREIRVMVKPDDVDDIGAAVLARDVAKQIEEELTYPGQIRVTVVRESPGHRDRPLTADPQPTIRGVATRCRRRRRRRPAAHLVTARAGRADRCPCGGCAAPASRRTASAAS